MSEAPCTTCGGSGWYPPAFSSASLINCPSCNADWSKEPKQMTFMDEAPAPKSRGYFDD